MVKVHASKFVPGVKLVRLRLYDPQDGRGALVHAKRIVGPRLGHDATGQVFEALKALGGGDLAIFEAADDLPHALGEAAVLDRAFIDQFAGHAFEFIGLRLDSVEA